MGLRIDTSNNDYHWATSDTWYAQPVTITIHNDDNTDVKLGGIRLQMISCNAGNHSVDGISTVQTAGQSGNFVMLSANGYSQISQIVQIHSESRSNVCTEGAFTEGDTWFLPRYTRDHGAQYDMKTYDGTYISKQDYNDAFYTFRFSTPVTVPANSYTQVILALQSGWGTWQLSDLVIATPLPTYRVTYKPNDGNWSGSTADVVHEVIKGENDTLPAAPTRAGFDFIGWSPSGAPPTNVQSNHTYTAQWRQSKVTVTFYRNQKSKDNRTIRSDSDKVDPNGQVEIGTTLAEAKPRTNPTWIDAVGDGVTETPQFLGWSGSSEGTPYTPQGEQKQKITANNKDFYAQWAIPNIYFYQNLTAQDDKLLGHGVASANSLVGAEGAPVLEDPPPHYEYPENRIRLGIPRYDEDRYMHVAGINVYRDVMDNIRTVLANATDPLVFYGWRKDRQYHILEAGQDCTCQDLRTWRVNSDDNQNKYYAVWKRVAAIWVVETYDDNGTMRKRWVKKRNVHQVVLEGQTKSWVDVPSKIVTLNGQTKQWEDDT